MADSGGAAAGWYPDPGGAGALRWWDGQQWTEHTHATPATPGTGGPRGAAPTSGTEGPWGAAPPATATPGTEGSWGGTTSGFSPTEPGWGDRQPGFGATQPGWGATPGAETGPSGFGAGPPGWDAQQPGPGPFRGHGGTPVRIGWRTNRYAFITLGVCVLYVALAVVTHLVFIGILPIFMSARAVRAKERLAPVAVIAAILVIVVSITTAYA